MDDGTKVANADMFPVAGTDRLCGRLYNRTVTIRFKWHLQYCNTGSGSTLSDRGIDADLYLSAGEKEGAGKHRNAEGEKRELR